MGELALQIAVHLFVHGTVVLGVAWLAVRYLADVSAACQHAIWTTAFVVLLLVPFGYGMLPGWQLDLLSPASVDGQTRWSLFSASGHALSDRAQQDLTAAMTSERSAGASSVRGTSASADASGADAASSLFGTRWLVPGFLAIWLGGVLILLGRIGLGMVSLWTWKKQAIDIGCSEVARQLARRLGLPPAFEVLGAPEARSPIVWGAISPVILLPTDATSWPETRLRAVLLHELAHVKRRDYLTHFLGRVVRALFWPNPLIWKAIERSSAAQEQACDDTVLRSGIAPWEYAEHLLAVIKTLRAPFPANAVALNSGRRFKSRMRALLQSATPRRAVTRWEVGALGLVGAGLLALLSAFHVGSSTPLSPDHERLWIEAEGASLPPAFERNEDDAASQGSYVTITARADDLDREPDTDPAVYSFETSSTGQHIIWARVRVRSDDHDSFWVRVDSTRWIRWNGIEQGKRWHWVQIRDADREGRPVVFALSKGEHHLMLARREDGISIDQFLVTTDRNYQPRGAEKQAPSERNHQIWLEAEEGWLQAPLHVAHAPDASGWQHIEARPDDVSLTSPPATGHATYSFAVPQTGEYRLWGRVMAESGHNNSFWIRMDSGRWIRWNGIPPGDRWHWNEVYNADHNVEPVRFELSDGTHRLTVAYREKHAKLDRLLLTDNPNYRPRGAGTRPDSLVPFSATLTAADAELVAPMVARADSQSADPRPWIEVPDGPGNDAPEGGPGTATFTFSVPRAGRYVLWGEVLAPHSNDNSFYVAVNGGEESTWHAPAPGRTTSSWQWDAISDGREDAFTDPVIFSLEAGTHTLRIRNREDGTRLRRLRITNVPTFDHGPIAP